MQAKILIKYPFFNPYFRNSPPLPPPPPSATVYIRIAQSILSLFEVYVACVMMVYKYSPFRIWITPNRGIFSFPSLFFFLFTLLFVFYFSFHSKFGIPSNLRSKKLFNTDWLKQMGVYLHVYKISTHNNVSLLTYKTDRMNVIQGKMWAKREKRNRKKEECEWKCLHRMYFMHRIFFL